VLLLLAAAGRIGWRAASSAPGEWRAGAVGCMGAGGRLLVPEALDAAAVRLDTR
jgi:hypothetical protein